MCWVNHFKNCHLDLRMLLHVISALYVQERTILVFVECRRHIILQGQSAAKLFEKCSA